MNIRSLNKFRKNITNSLRSQCRPIVKTHDRWISQSFFLEINVSYPSEIVPQSFTVTTVASISSSIMYRRLFFFSSFLQLLLPCFHSIQLFRNPRKLLDTMRRSLRYKTTKTRPHNIIKQVSTLIHTLTRENTAFGLFPRNQHHRT
jgi:hypothetical protein